MEPNEIMTNNEEIMETATEEIVKAGSGSKIKTVAGLVLGTIAGVVICKVVLPKIAQIKARKQTKTETVEAKVVDFNPADVNDEAETDD